LSNPEKPKQGGVSGGGVASGRVTGKDKTKKREVNVYAKLG